MPSKHKNRPAQKPRLRALPRPLPLDGLPEWSEIPGHEPLRQWGADLRRALDERSVDTWRLAGRMALLSTSPGSWGFEALCKLGEELHAKVRSVSAEELLRLPKIGTWKERGPSLLLIEPGEWQEIDFAEDASTEAYAQSVAVVEWIEESLATAPPTCGVVLAMVARDTTASPIGLRRVGLLDRFIELPPQTDESRGRQLIDMIGAEFLGESILAHPARFAHEFHSEHAESRRKELAILYIRRHVWRTGAPFEFRDLIKLELQGYAASAGEQAVNEFERRSTAYHEAGHAVVAILDSDQANTPELASIVPTRRYHGVVRNSSSYHISKGDFETYKTFRHTIRVLLAGRAAEELAMGAEHVSNGCVQDLDIATGKTLAAFSFWGFLPDMDVASNTGSNLLVCIEEEDDRLHEAEVEHRFALGRGFLDREYQYVLTMLKKHRPLLDRVASALMEQLTLDQEMLTQIVKGGGTGT